MAKEGREKDLALKLVQAPGRTDPRSVGIGLQ